MWFEAVRYFQPRFTLPELEEGVKVCVVPAEVERSNLTRSINQQNSTIQIGILARVDSTLAGILYIFDPRTKSVVIGSVLFPNNVNADGTTAPEVNEFGGRVKRRAKRAQGHVFSIGERGPIREISQPSPRSKRFARPILVSAKLPNDEEVLRWRIGRAGYWPDVARNRVQPPLLLSPNPFNNSPFCA